MTLTVKFLNEIIRQWGSDHVDKPLEHYLLATYEEEPFPYEWSEQDLYEQVRKLIFQYEQGILDISIPSPLERQKMRCEALKESYMELLRENIKLHVTISSDSEILVHNNHQAMPIKDPVINF